MSGPSEIYGIIVEVPKCDYDDLLRASEKLETIKRLITANTYVSTSDLLAILDIKKEEAKKNAPT